MSDVVLFGTGAFAQVACEICYVFGIIAQTTAIEARRELLHGRLREQLQNIS